MSESHAQTTAVDENQASVTYWKFCCGVLGIGFLISAASHSGPARASASDAANFDQSNHLQVTHQQAQQSLSIGGFDSIEGTPVFVIYNQSGQRIGTLPMELSTKPDTPID